MGFCVQLKLLLWKNFMLRKRQKVRLVVEIVWPLFLFVILMWVRTRELKKYLPECHFDEKALPSAGFLPTLQSYICTVNNTCYEQVTEKDDYVSTYNDSLLTKLLYDLEDIFKEHLTTESLQSIDQVRNDLGTLQELREKFDYQQQLLKGEVPLVEIFPELQSILSRHNISDDTETLKNATFLLHGARRVSVNALSLLWDPALILCNSTEFYYVISSTNGTALENLRSHLCSLSLTSLQKISQELMANINYGNFIDQLSVVTEDNVGRSLSTSDWKAVPGIMSRMGTQIQDLDSVMQAFSALQAELLQDLYRINSTQGPEAAIAALFCGKDVRLLPGGNSSGEMPLLAEEMREKAQQATEDKNSGFKYDETVSRECNNLFQMLETNRSLRFVWRQIKPFIRGKILYYPDTKLTRRIMIKINGSFSPVNDMYILSGELMETTFPALNSVFIADSSPIRFWQTVTNPLVLDTNPMADGLLRMVLQTPLVKDKLQVRMEDIRSNMRQLNRYTDEERLGTYRQAVSDAQNIWKLLHTLLGCYEFHKFEGFNDPEKLMERAKTLVEENKLWAAIEFTEEEKYQGDSLPPFVRYKIRMDAYKVDNTMQIIDRITRPGPRRRSPIDIKYLVLGFIHIQDLVERAIILLQTSHQVMTGIWMQQFPYPCHIRDRFILAISRTFPMFMTLAWVYTSAMLIKSIVYEKENRLKEVMRTMGLGNIVHWVGWFINSFVMMLITIILLTLILKYGRVMEHSDPLIIFLFLLCFTTSAITLSFLISTIFSRANLSAAAGGILYFITYLPFPLLVRWGEQGVAKGVKVSASLLCTVGFGFGCSYFAQMEEMGIGVQWDNVGAKMSADVDYPLTEVMSMLILDAIIYMLLTLYIETVFPGEFGIPLPWYFLCTQQFWCGSKTTKPSSSHRLSHAGITAPHGEMGNGKAAFEEEPSHLPLGVSVVGLSKVYPGGKKAVDNLSVNFYESQITSFLGHNGAGKTTTISILTGMFPPTTGTAFVYGKDIRTRMPEIRQDLGMCPQHNVLFDYLTVQEHLWFYARLKGCPDTPSLKKDIRLMVTDTGLSHKNSSQSATLSGGMKRKLSIGIAFVGGSKVVILDEPTAGVDPFSRRSIWDLLLKYKNGRTIILTTHYMDEADLLGDRIAIIAHGELQCCGSSLFLKTMFGSGYYLTLVKAEPKGGKNAPSPNIHTAKLMDTEPDEGIGEATSSSVDSHSEKSSNDSAFGSEHSTPSVEPHVTAFIRKHIPEATLVEDIGFELSYILPASSQSGKKFETFFNDLESKLKDLGLRSYGISDTTLEEVFLKVGGTTAEEALEQNGLYASRVRAKRLKKILRCCYRSRTTKVLEINERERVELGLDDEDAAETTKLKRDVADPPPVQYKPVTGFRLLMQQFTALVVKRYYHSIRNKKGLFCEIVLPAVFVCLALLFTLITPPAGNKPPLEMTPWLYGPPNYVFFSNVDKQAYLPKKYEDSLVRRPYFGARCVTGEPLNLPCGDFEPDLSQLVSEDKPPNPPIPCACDKGTPICSPEALRPAPPQMEIPTTDYLINMTGRNISDWLVKTEKTFSRSRYGGYTFGLKNPLGLLNVSAGHDFFDRLTRAANLGVPVLNNSLRLFNTFDEGMRRLEVFDNVKVWFNNKGWASSVAYLNAINNVILRSHLPDGVDRTQYGISVINHPVNLTSYQMIEELENRSVVSLLQAICVIFAMSFVPASFILFLIDERVTKFKHLQFVSGVQPVVYWFVNYLWDMLCYLATACLCIIIFLAFNEDSFVSERHIGPLCLLLILYGFASIPLMYPASFICTVPSSAFVALACGNLFIGIVTTVATFILEVIDDDELQDIAEILKQVFLMFPHYCLGRGLMDLVSDQFRIDALRQLGLVASQDLFEWKMLGRNFFCMIIQGIGGFILTLLIEYKFFWKPKQSKTHAQSKDGEDEDVAAERRRVLSGTAQKAVLRVENLSKTYHSSSCSSSVCKCFRRHSKVRPKAVDQLCFGVEFGECFGLLGVNGAGKTTTFKMLTGDTSVTSGNAFLNNFSILKDMRHARKHMGYCPQFDALDSLMTAHEHLVLFAKLKGVPPESVDKVADVGVTKLGLRLYANRRAGTYSGGNKRKLSTAIALVGDPLIIFLDEPTTGMDPKAKRFLWNCILRIVKEGRSVVLTTHSMEECEALCTKLAIMVNGQFKCFGSIQHLKNRFGEGYTLLIRVSGSIQNLEAVVKYIQDNFPKAVLKEEHYNQVQFQIPLKDLALSRLFSKMEDARTRLNIEDYSITQTTLDQVFINFAKEQSEADEEATSRRNNRLGASGPATELLLSFETTV